MKVLTNIWVYYFAIITPLIILILSRKLFYINSNTFVILLLLYVSIYRTLIDGYRLYYKNIIDRKDIWKRSIPGWFPFKYFKELYLVP